MYVRFVPRADICTLSTRTRLSRLSNVGVADTDRRYAVLKRRFRCITMRATITATAIVAVPGRRLMNLLG